MTTCRCTQIPPRPPVALLLLLLLAAPAVHGGDGSVRAPILNGVSAAGGAPEVGWLFTSRNVCSATLIGCNTLLTAAHCLCELGQTGAECTPVPGRVLLPSAGVYDVTSAVHPEFRFGAGGDVAVLHADRPVEGVAPLPLRPASRLPFGSEARLVGFGRRDDGSSGLLSRGDVTTAPCPPEEAKPETHLCWDFRQPLRPPGEEANGCFGDSGGPLLTSAESAGRRVAGVISGTSSDDCRAPAVGWATDASVHRDWITAQAAEPLGERCSPLQVGDPGVAQVVAEGTVAPSEEQEHALSLPQGYDRLLIAFNATRALSFTAGSCTRIDKLGGVCELRDTEPGQMPLILTSRAAAETAYQLTVTAFGGSPPRLSDRCRPDDHTLCLQGGRFRVTVDWNNRFGTSGRGRVVPVESDDSGIFTFFSADNWEVMVKVLDACVASLGQRFWVFYAATTNQGFTLRVEDTWTDSEQTYVNPLGQVAETRLDTDAFATCP